MDARSNGMSKGCVTCPFSENDGAEELLNYGCLPTPYDILKMKKESGHNWACHYNENSLCRGLVEHNEKYNSDLNLTTGNLISYETWYYEEEEAAILEANQKQKGTVE